MKVPSLVDFYNNQNRLAVEAASQTASNQTQAGIANKRLQQEQQLTRFSQMMENMRQARALKSNESIEMAKMVRDDARSKLGRDFQHTENATEQAFRKELAGMELAGQEAADIRRQQGAEKVATIQAQGRQPTAAEQQEASARARLLTAQADAVSKPDMSNDAQLLIQISQNKDALKKTLGGDKGVQRLVDTITARMKAAGVDPDTIPEVAEIKSSQVKERAAQLAKTLDKDFESIKQTGAEQALMTQISAYQNMLTSGRLSPKNQVVAQERIRAYAKKLGLNPTAYGF